ncbi:uncharacterized protein LOC135465999 [Liolophura sinensis]|uniref:uncharacterized protein LOC135465999 n=1 Tax=Liolophura sinensis TaxID=3198878 RepID=UPI00315873E5
MSYSIFQSSDELDSLGVHIRCVFLTVAGDNASPYNGDEGSSQQPVTSPVPERKPQLLPFDLSTEKEVKSKNAHGHTQTNPKRPEQIVHSESSTTQTQPSSVSGVIIPNISRTDLDLEYRDDGACGILGEGGYGYFQRGKLVQEEQTTDIAAEFFKPNRASVEEIEREVKTQRYLQVTGAVPKVHGLINMARRSSDPILVKEYVGQGTTVEGLMLRGGEKKTWLQFAIQGAKGLQKIHKKGVLLNDKEFDNILLDESNDRLKVKFVDMGMATYNSSYTGTVDPADMADRHHIAQEVVYQAPPSVKSDLYSFEYVLRTVAENADPLKLEILGTALSRDLILLFNRWLLLQFLRLQNPELFQHSQGLSLVLPESL